MLLDDGLSRFSFASNAPSLERAKKLLAAVAKVGIAHDGQ